MYVYIAQGSTSMNKITPSERVFRSYYVRSVFSEIMTMKQF